MWNNGGNFGGGGIGGGGGFLESSSQSPSADGEKKSRDRRADNIVPVSIGQIHRDTGEDFKIGGVLVHLVTCVAMVKNMEVTSTKSVYQIEDFSGQIEALMWNDGTLETYEPTLNTYCRVSGSVRVSQGKKNIMIFRLQPVTDLNELTYHLLEVIDVYQCAPNIKNEPIRNSNIPSTSVNSANNTLSNSMMNMNQDDDGLDHAPADPQQRMVFKIISDAASNDEGGVDVHFIAKKLNGKLGEHQVRSITDFLLQEGFIFSTVDDEHFTVTK